MVTLRQLIGQYGNADCLDLSPRQQKNLRDGLKNVKEEEITSAEDGRAFIELLKTFRQAVAENDKLHGENYPELLKSILSVGEDGIYSNSLRFIFELIQNVDDCDYRSPDDCRLEMFFDIRSDEIVLTYNEVGFTPFNVFAITGIAEAAKNISSDKDEIGEKGIGFKSVFGVAEKVLIRSGWFSFELSKENFTIPESSYRSSEYCPGTQMTLYVPGQAEKIYREIKRQYCRQDAIFSRNPLLFLNKLTSLRMFYDVWRSMEFRVSRSGRANNDRFEVERDVELSVNLRDYENGTEIDVKEQIICSRYSYPVIFTREACQSRYGKDTRVGLPDGKPMTLRVVLPNQEYVSNVGKGALYSFLPTQLKLTVPLVCHVPFKLDASREFVDPQGDNLWFREASRYLSELIDYSYMDWRTVVKEGIVQYLPGPGENLFARNNGKELCLSRQTAFSGAHYLDLPLFFTTDRKYHRADEIFCFDQEEHITDPEKVYRLMGFQKYLFVPPVPVSRFGFETERGIKDQLFKQAFFSPRTTAEALDYLDAEAYVYSENQIPNQDSVDLTENQIRIMFGHSRLAAVLQTAGSNSVQKGMRLKISVGNGKRQPLADVLFEDFELSETPDKVEQYLRLCNEKCICLDIGENDFFPCHNAVVLSEKNPLASFAAFCYSIDKSDTFTVRIKLREASRRLNRYVEEGTGSAAEFIRDLGNTRSLIKESLGTLGYRNYIDLILRSGTDKGRFIQELLQNADDCDYLPGVVPTFSLTKKENTIITEYNETGFSRANIRSITAIGESTKNKLISGQFSAIGEKGVGFKTIFSVASKVKIYSGEYSFSLTDQEPTIPKWEKPLRKGPAAGTRMDVILKDRDAFPEYRDNEMLELCLCLRKLRSIRIGSHHITIEDDGERRTITIDRRKHVFRRFIHSFRVSDENAIKERRIGNREISSDQTIVCMIPEKGGLSEYALYNGLPTKHRVKIPMVFDAPFALTTSREEIETGCAAWNDIVRRELYMALIEVIESLKATERARVLRFTRFVPRMLGNMRAYVNDISDCSYLTSYDFLNELKSREILPTFDRNVFQAPKNSNIFRFPGAAVFLFGKVAKSEYAGVKPSSIIDVEGNDYEAALNAMGCVSAPFDQVFPVIEKHAERFVRQDEFRSMLYELLQEIPDEYRETLKELEIIPVYGQTPGSVEYVNWKDDSIFVKKEAVTSSADYYVLNEEILSKTDCERIYDSNINEMNEEWERSRYNERLSHIVRGVDIGFIYQFLIAEFRSGSLQRNQSLPTLIAASDTIPLKNELGEIVDNRLFLCEQPTGYFPVKMIQRMIVHKECAPFAQFMHCGDLSGVHYDDFEYREMLTADDVETLTDDYFVNSEEILRGFYRDGLLSDELLGEYALDYLAIGRAFDFGESYQFPSAPVGDRRSIRKHVRKLWESPLKIVPVQEKRTVYKGKKEDGTLFDLDRQEAREGSLRTYTPDGAEKHCFCQMCNSFKAYGLMEVNNIELKPRYYFPQMRVALCLECSKIFESLRNNTRIRTKFIESILEASIEDQGTVDIRIGKENVIKFTAKHLAEIQEILKQMPTE